MKDNKTRPGRHASLVRRAVAGSPFGRWWGERTPFARHWIINILFGLAIESALLLGHHSAPLVHVQDLAFDRMIRINAVFDPAARGTAPPLQTFIDIDEATFRSPAWGGGEPERAPRDGLLALIDKALAQGASQIVLDVAVEGGAAGAERAEDTRFAEALAVMLDSGHLGPQQTLVLVRSLRPPLEDDALVAAHDSGPVYLNEMREAPAIDPLLARADPRLVAAAPYFSQASDRVLRDWHLFSVLCRRADQAGHGSVHILPSVQLVVAARRAGMDLARLDRHGAGKAAATGPCVPFPAGDSAAGAVLDAARQNGRSAHEASGTYWSALQRAGLRVGEQPSHGSVVGNRVVFRSGYPFKRDDPYFERIPASVFLASNAGQALTGRVVVIGQSHRQSADSYFTPLGTMPGAVVLVNAIDSMARYDGMEAASSALSLPLALLSIVLVGYVYARWGSLTGTLISTMLILLLFAVASVFLFRSGLWLDFALPLLGIQAHRMIRAGEEYLEHRSATHVTEGDA